MYNILQFVILLANVCCIGYFLYQAGKLKMTHDDETPFVITCEDCSDLSQIAEVREKAIAIAKELSVGYYMENGDEDMR